MCILNPFHTQKHEIENSKMSPEMNMRKFLYRNFSLYTDSSCSSDRGFAKSLHTSLCCTSSILTLTCDRHV